MGRWRDKVKVSAYNKKYAKEHPEKVLEKKQRDYAKHHEKRTASMRRYAASHRDIMHKRVNARNRQKLGWSEESYQAAFTSQGGCCALCGVHQSALKRALSADHDHVTGLSRELLCTQCNMGLGAFSDKIELFEKAVAYLKKWAVR